MDLSKLIARQLGSPTGIVGTAAGFLWNRRNAALNDTVLGLLDLQPGEDIRRLALELIEAKPDPKYGKKYAGLWQEK